MDHDGGSLVIRVDSLWFRRIGAKVEYRDFDTGLGSD